MHEALGAGIGAYNAEQLRPCLGDTTTGVVGGQWGVKTYEFSTSLGESEAIDQPVQG